MSDTYSEPPSPRVNFNEDDGRFNIRESANNPEYHIWEQVCLWVNGENRGTYTVSDVITGGNVIKYKLVDTEDNNNPVLVNGEEEIEQGMLKPPGESSSG